MEILYWIGFSFGFFIGFNTIFSFVISILFIIHMYKFHKNSPNHEGKKTRGTTKRYSIDYDKIKHRNSPNHDKKEKVFKGVNA